MGEEVTWNTQYNTHNIARHPDISVDSKWSQKENHFSFEVMHWCQTEQRYSAHTFVPIPLTLNLMGTLCDLFYIIIHEY